MTRFDEEKQRQEYERLARREADIIERLSSLVHDLIVSLSYYKDIEGEESRLDSIMELREEIDHDFDGDNRQD